MMNIVVSLLFDVVLVFKQKTAYEMRISDWSSDVCSSDLSSAVVIKMLHQFTRLVSARRRPSSWPEAHARTCPTSPCPPASRACNSDRKSVVSGKSVSVRVDLGGRRSIKKKNIYTTQVESMSLHENVNQ